jgi:hypothetical protein
MTSVSAVGQNVLMGQRAATERPGQTLKNQLSNFPANAEDVAFLVNGVPKLIGLRGFEPHRLIADEAGQRCYRSRHERLPSGADISTIYAMRVTALFLWRIPKLPERLPRALDELQRRICTTAKTSLQYRIYRIGWSPRAPYFSHRPPLDDSTCLS